MAPELEHFTSYIEEGINSDIEKWEFPPEFRQQREKIKDLFYARPLKEMAPDQAEAQKAFADNLQKASRLAENLCNAVNNNF